MRRAVIVLLALLVAAPAAHADDPEWILVTITRVNDAPAEVHAPALIRTSSIVTVLEGPDGVALVVTNPPAEDSTLLVAESIEDLCAVLDCARVAAKTEP